MNLLPKVSTESRRSLLYGLVSQITYRRSFNIAHAMRMEKHAHDWVRNLSPWDVEDCYWELRDEELRRRIRG